MTSLSKLILLSHNPDTITMNDQRTPLETVSQTCEQDPRQIRRTEPAGNGIMTGGADLYYDTFATAMQAFISENAAEAAPIKGGSPLVITFDEESDTPEESEQGLEPEPVPEPGSETSLLQFLEDADTEQENDPSEDNTRETDNSTSMSSRWEEENHDLFFNEELYN